MHKQTALDFFEKFLFSPDEKITIRCFRDRGKTGDQKKDAISAKTGTVDSLLPFIEAVNRETYGAYFVVNATEGGTADADILHARALFIDIDDAACPAYFPVEPSAILRRSDGAGYHVYWFLSEPETNLAVWTAAQKTLIAFYKSDKVIHNPARLMRIPGTVNHKESCDAPIYEIESINEKRYTLADVITGHAGNDKRLEQARARIAAVFDGKEIADGDGRHKAFIQVAYILNDYGFSGVDAKAEVERASQKYLKNPYTPAEIETFLAGQKYAKGEKGNALVDKAVKDQAKVDRMRECVKDWYYVRQQESFFMEGSPLPVTQTGFNAKFAYAADQANPARFVFMHDIIKQYESLVYDPSEPREIVTVGGVNRNMYTPPALEPVDAFPQWFLDHMEYLLPEKAEREHVLDYLAFLVQNPGAKIMHSILILGAQGIGKSILQRLFAKLFGEENVAAPHNENLSGAFTGWAKHCQLVVINELMQVDKKDFNNKIKPFITEPTIEIREMYRAPYTVKNCMNIIAFSNHDNALYIDADDRRWFVVQSPAVRRAPEYYENLVDCMDTRAGEVLHFLQSRDIAHFRPGATPPTTTAKRAMAENCISDLDAWVIEQIESGASPCDVDVIALDDLMNALPRSMQSKFVTVNRLSRSLRYAGAVRHENRIMVDGVRKRLWVLRNHEKYQTNAEVAAAVGDKNNTEIVGFVS